MRFLRLCPYFNFFHLRSIDVDGCEMSVKPELLMGFRRFLLCIIQLLVGVGLGESERMRMNENKFVQTKMLGWGDVSIILLD